MRWLTNMVDPKSHEADRKAFAKGKIIGRPKAMGMVGVYAEDDKEPA